MNSNLRKKILKEIHTILEQVNLGTETEKASGGNAGRTAAVGLAGLAAAPITGGLSLLPAAATMIASIVEGSPAELQDAIARCEKDPKGLADLIKSQLASRYINDNESEAMVGVARAYQTHCKGGDTSWCKKVIQNFPDYKTEIQSKWSASNIGGQLKDKLELIRLLDEFSGMEDTKPTPAPTPEPTPTPPEPDNGGGKGKGRKGKPCVRCKNVKKGCKGSVVKEIHDKLVALKLIPATSKEVTSQTFGAETEKVIRDFQTAKKIKLDGIVGNDTSKALGIKCGTVDDKGSTEDTTPKCKDGTPAPGGDVSKCPPDSKPEPKPEPETGGMTEFQALRTARKMMDRNMSDIAQRLVSFFISSGKTPQQAYDKVSGLLGPDGRKFWDVNDAFGPGSSKEINDRAKAFRRGLEDVTGKTYSEILKLPLKNISAESRQFKYENYYDFKKEKEANILFERLVKKL